jgi:hypothetical protein
MQNAAFNTPNTEIGGRLGSVVYQATCGCSFAHAYPFSIGPHLGVAYQITPKTVFRAGGAISYAAQSDQAGLNVSVPDFYGIGAPAYGTPAAILKYGNPYGPGNPFGNPPLVWPNFNPLFPTPAAPGVIPPASPFISIDPGTGRLPRIWQWSIGFQREIVRNMVVRCGLCWQPRYLVGCAFAGLAELQCAHAARSPFAIWSECAKPSRCPAAQYAHQLTRCYRALSIFGESQ